MKVGMFDSLTSNPVNSRVHVTLVLRMIQCPKGKMN